MNYTKKYFSLFLIIISLLILMYTIYKSEFIWAVSSIVEYCIDIAGVVGE